MRVCVYKWVFDGDCALVRGDYCVRCEEDIGE